MVNLRADWNLVVFTSFVGKGYQTSAAIGAIISTVISENKSKTGQRSSQRSHQRDHPRTQAYTHPNGHTIDAYFIVLVKTWRYYSLPLASMMLNSMM